MDCMEVHIFIWSTMSPEMTAQNLNEIGFRFDTSAGTIQRFRWTRGNHDALQVSLWVACTHPLIYTLVEMCMSSMDACVCLYHDHDTLSCLRVENTVRKMEQYTDSIWLMTTTFPRILTPHASKVTKYYDSNGFERTRLTKGIGDNIKQILQTHLSQHRYTR